MKLCSGINYRNGWFYSIFGIILQEHLGAKLEFGVNKRGLIKISNYILIETVGIIT